MRCWSSLLLLQTGNKEKKYSSVWLVFPDPLICLMWLHFYAEEAELMTNLQHCSHAGEGKIQRSSYWQMYINCTVLKLCVLTSAAAHTLTADVKCSVGGRGGVLWGWVWGNLHLPLIACCVVFIRSVPPLSLEGLEPELKSDMWYVSTPEYSVEVKAMKWRRRGEKKNHTRTLSLSPLCAVIYFIFFFFRPAATASASAVASAARLIQRQQKISVHSL